MAEIQGIVKALDASRRVIDIEDVPDAIPERGEYSCLLCGSRLIAKKGTKVMHHFAHHSATECDTWASGMTEWHLAGQRLLEQRGARLEVPFKHEDTDGHRHRIDALVTDGHGYRTGFELQHSPMSTEMFDVRNKFYLDELDELIWVFDVRGKDVGIDMRLSAPWELREFDGYLGHWTRSPGWFDGHVLDGWHKRRLTVFLYVSGRDDWTDGRIVEVLVPPGFDRRHPERWVGRECLACEWADEVARRRGSFVMRNRTHDLTYSYHDGTSETRPVRCGARLPRPRRRPPVPQGKEEDLRGRPSRMPSRPVTVEQRLVDKMLSVRLVGTGCRIEARLPYGSDRARVMSSLGTELGRRGKLMLAGRIPEGDIPPVLTGDVTLRLRDAGRGDGRAGGPAGSSRRKVMVPRTTASAPSPRPAPRGTSPRIMPRIARQDATRPVAKRAGVVRHRVDVIDEAGTPLGFASVPDGSSLADAVADVRASLSLFGTADGYEWPGGDALRDRVYDDMEVTIRGVRTPLGPSGA